MASLRAKSRPRPLHTCASSMLGIIDTAYRRSQQLDGPLGNFIKRLTTLGSSAIPFASKLQHLGLTTLSLTDDHILFLERIVESVFPPSRRLFNKIDMIVCSVEGLPNRFDEALNTFPSMMHQVPFLDWVLMHIIWCLNLLISILTNWGSRHTKEKEIMIDMTFDPCGNNPIESPTKPDYSGKAQEQFLFIESPVKANSTVLIESTDKQNFNEAQAQSIVKSADKEIADEAQGQSMMKSDDKQSFDEPLSQSIAGSNEFVESADKENGDETQGQSMVSSNESVESTDKENLGESLGQSVVFVEENVNEAMGESMEVSNKTEDSAETQEQSIYQDQDQEQDQEMDQMITNENTLSPTESFQSAQFEDTISPSPTNESFHETKSFENIELPTTDEDETKVKLFKKEGKEKLDHIPFKTAQTAAASSSYGKNRGKGEKKTSVKDKKKNDNKVEDQAKILELLEAKWHMM